MTGNQLLMLALPEVAYLVDRIPIARLAIKPTAVQVRFFQHASDSRMPLRQQCEYLGIPWHARKVPANFVSIDVLRVAKQLDAQTFGQAMPKTGAEMAKWCKAILNGVDGALPDHAILWLAHHGAEIGDSVPEVFSYLKKAAAVPVSTSSKIVVERAQRRAAQIHRTLVVRCDHFHIAGVEGRIFDPCDYSWEEISPREAHEPTSTVFSLDYPAHVTAPFYEGELSLHILADGEAFRRAGRELINCLSDRDSRLVFSGRTERNYFREAHTKGNRYAVIRRANTAVAAVSYDRNGKLFEAKAAANKDLIDLDVLRLALKFSEHLSSSDQGSSDRLAGTQLTGVIVDEWQDIVDRAPRPDTWRRMARFIGWDLGHD